MLPEDVQIAVHHGLHTVTIGQKTPISGAPTKLYVCEKDIPNNTIYVVAGG